MNETPLIDKRSRADIVKQATELARYYAPEWYPQEAEDPGLAFIHLFSRLMEIIITRLNQVPDKNFLSFLDVVGVTPLAPKAARAPVKFILAAGAPADGSVPQKTPLATAPTGGEEPVTFETEKGLVVSRSLLKNLFSHDPANDRYTDLDAVLKANEMNQSLVFNPFTGEQLIRHTLYIAQDIVFNISLPTALRVTFTLDQLNEAYETLFDEGLSWTIWAAGSERRFKPQSVDVDGNNATVEFPIISELEKTTINDKEHFWLGAEISKPLTDHLSTLKITAITATSSTHGILPELAFYNAAALDTSREFYPFGEKPKQFDTFFLAIAEAFTKEGSSITIGCHFLPGFTPDGVVLQWEFWKGERWETLGVSSRSGTQNGTAYNFLDFTNAFTAFTEFILLDRASPSKPTLSVVALKDGVTLDVGDASSEEAEKFKLTVNNDNGTTEIFDELTIDTVENRINSESELIRIKNLESPSSSPENLPDVQADILPSHPRLKFTCPKIEKTKVNGQENYWIRARILSGNYGEDAKMTRIDESGDNTLENWEYQAPSFQPPVVIALTISYEYEQPQPLISCCLYNNFTYQEISIEKQEISPFFPFEHAEGFKPVFYLGFDYPFSNTSVSLYLSVEEQAMKEPPLVVWEYWNGANWNNLGVQDETKNLTESGLVEFIGPVDFKAKEQFEKNRYWIRVKLEQGDAANMKLLGVYPNSTWAVNASTIKDEILGSSSETPGATFTLSRFPVLEGQKIKIREPEKPSEAEFTFADESKELWPEYWVLWQEVDHFRFSSETDRHYIIDRATGRVTFGDGINGMVPLAGRDNIKAVSYRAGGGEKGNVPKNTITVLKRALPFVDKVFNVAGAGGGSEVEALNQVKIRGPQDIKHRDRAVTWEDYQWLAKEASFQVARTRCLPARKADKAGKVTLILVPQSDSAKPKPSEGLIRQVQSYLAPRMISTSDLIVEGPKYIEVSVEADIHPERLEEADFVRRSVNQNLETFFHPLKGGPDGKGWEFGRDVHVSEVCKVIEDTIGVDHVKNIDLFEISKTGDKTRVEQYIDVPDDHLVASGKHKIDVG